MATSLEFLVIKQKSNELFIDTEHSKKIEYDILMLGHVFKYIHKNFDKLHLNSHMSDVLPILHHSLRLELQTGKTLHIGTFVNALLNLNDNNNDVALRSCLQILYQILETLLYKDTEYLQIGNEVFYKLIEILLSHKSSSNNANILACLQLYVNKFNSVEVITHLWESIKDDLNTNKITERIELLQTFIHLFYEFLQHIKDFKKSIDFEKLILRLLDSDQHDNRKCAYFLLKKTYMLIEEQKKVLYMVTEKPVEDTNPDQFWNICINILENLEENQSHLILPSLEQLKTLNFNASTKRTWIDILYRQILRHNNILVRRWILEFIIERTKYSSLADDTQLQFLHALNETALYNFEDYVLPTKYIETFLQESKLNFLMTFSEINWKAVPLHFWLSKLMSEEKSLPNLDAFCSKNGILKLATKIRALQNVRLREKTILVFLELFSLLIDEMKLANYIQLVESLYNVSDCFDAQLLFLKIKHCNEYKFDGDRIFSLRIYNILNNQIRANFKELSEILSEKIRKYDWTLGSFRFLMIFHSPTFKVDQICKLYYGIDKSVIEPTTPLNELYEKFYELATDDLERICIKQQVTDCYGNLYESYDDMRTNEIDIEELISAGSIRTLFRLATLIKKSNIFMGDKMFMVFLQNFRDHLKNKYVCFSISDLLMEHLVKTTSHANDYSMRLLNLDLENEHILKAVSKNSLIPDKRSFLIKNATMINTKVGDPRIEEAYECKIYNRPAKLYHIRNEYNKKMGSITDLENHMQIFYVLCTEMTEINERRPKYYANCKEHRMVQHILASMLTVLPKMVEIQKGCPTDLTSNDAYKLWSLLLNENNQQDVTILCEIIIAHMMSFSMLLSTVQGILKTRKCTASQELSMIALLHRSVIINWLSGNIKRTEFEDVIYLLWPLTMGPNFQTRLNSRLAVVALIERCSSLIKNNTDRQILIIGLHATLRDTLSEEELAKFKNDLRFQLIEISNAFNCVMDYTNAPYDEYDFTFFNRFPTKTKLPKKEMNSESTIDAVTNYNVQRKMNPVADFLPIPDIYAYPECKEKKFYVVASLIDKIPNLGGIARTCEVFGIRNLVIDSKAHITKPDFKNLSMTAEQNLNIEEVKPDALKEFILQKKAEGFKIIGAEQTSNSCSSVNFDFPKKSLLILGHEKEGIPFNILGFLDYAVEIPQFGMVRSLNVHVTAALLMWEYCKQHIVP